MIQRCNYLKTTKIMVIFIIILMYSQSFASQVKIYSDIPIFSVTIPTVLPVEVDEYGKVYTSNDTEIINNSLGSIVVEDVYIDTKNGWELADFNTDYTTKKVGIKEFGLNINGEDVGIDGKVQIEGTEVRSGDSLEIYYDAVIPAQKDNIRETIANVIFTVGWATEPVYYTVEFIAGDNGRLVGGSPQLVEDIFEGITVEFPEPIPNSGYYVFSHWEDVDTGREVYEEDHIRRNMTVEAVFEFILPGGPIQTVGNYTVDLETGTLLEYVGTTPIGNLNDIPTELAIDGIDFYIEHIGNNVFANKGITSVTIPNGILTIGDSAFMGNNNINSLAIPNSVLEIESGAFRNCRIHKNNVTIDNSIGSVYIGPGAFAGNHANGKTDIVNDIRYLR